MTFIPTPFAEVLLSLDWPAQTALRIMLVGGDKLRQYPSQEIPFTVVNNYGPTESTVVTTSGIVAADVDQHWAPSIGRAISNVQIHILDAHLHPVPVGIPGELYVSGDSLTKGYLNRPERTKDSFISGKTLPHLATSNDAYFYKTGDLVRYRPDGNLEFLGRIDHQVKIRGFRIELGEIEATLTTHPTVEQAVVIVRDDDNNNQKLVAYLVYRDTSISSTSELKRWLREALPSYMIPSIFVPLESMPLTPNGKIDRRALPEPDAIYSTPETSFAAPRDSIERAIAEAWTQVLGTGQISIHDNFFELGGHSLIATQIITRIETKFGVKLSLRNLFETPTIAELAIAAKAALEVAPKYKLPPIQKSFQSTHLPLSFAQNRLVFLQKLQPISPFYNIAISIHLQGVLKVEALEQSLNEILRRHDSLRTHFLDEGEHTYVIVKSFTDFTLPIVDLSELSSAEQEIQKQHLALEAACQPFNLSTDQLLRIKLLQLSEIEHLMLLTMHHSIADGWSINVFMRELVALYQAFATHATPSLPELPIQYIDFAIWQNQHLQEDFLAAELAYWKGKLADAPPLLQLTTDKPRPSVQTFTGNAQLFTLPKPLVEALRALSQQSGATLFMTLLAAFKVLLYRYTNVVDILIGVPIANRGQIDVESLIGYFVNTLVLRTDLGGNPSFQELLVRVREVALEAYAHQSLPFEKLLEELKLERSLGHSPLFQVMFSFEDTLELHFETSDLIFDLSPIDTNTSKFDLSLNLVEMDDGLMGRLEYNTDLFEPDTITRLIGNFRTLLEGIAKEPSKLLSELPLLTQAEQQRLFDYNNTHIDFPNTRSVHELFESQVAQTPDATAVVFGNQRLTYRELNQRSNQLAHYLQSLEVGPDILVGICLERSLEMVIGLLAILKAGSAYVPLDPAYPLDHLAFVLSDSQAKVLLTQQSLLATLPSHQAEIICLDADYELFSQASQANPVSRTNPESLAYVIYTSGSTGRPKGVMALHQGLLNLVFWHQSSFNVTASDCATQLAGTAFDASVWEIYPYLTTGATLHLIDKAILQSPKLLQDWLITQDITVTFVPTPLAEILLSLSWPEQLALRIMLVGGDKLHQYPPATIPFQVVNNYGPTENTVVTTSGVVNSANLEIGRSPSIGKPVANVQVYILDSYFQPVPIGVPGEMYVGGASLTRGYLNRPELTTERFISDCSGTHLSLSPSSRLYKTGDWARYLSDGNIEFLGRLDDQVKIRGFRIELGEIEATLAKHPAVKEVIVITRVESGKEQYLVAYVAVADDQFGSLSAQVKAIEHELRHFLKTKLPEYMVPSAFVVLDAFPLTPNGKVDRRALPEPDRQSGLEAIYVAPETSIEQDIAAIWRELLQLESVGAHDNFFTLGGHSLLLAKLQIALNESFHQELSIVDLFQYPTIRLLAAHIDQAQNTESLAQRAQERITTRQGRQASIKQSRQLRKQSRVGHTPEGGIR
ncbi:MAG: amino acid adenylation domain-containing protein [Cyanobacteria bacterium P01_F01_bin.86]